MIKLSWLISDCLIEKRGHEQAVDMRVFRCVEVKLERGQHCQHKLAGLHDLWDLDTSTTRSIEPDPWNSRSDRNVMTVCCTMHWRLPNNTDKHTIPSLSRYSGLSAAH
jgi:hypothetical protein